MKFGITYAAALVILLALDFIWLSNAAGVLYKPNMAGLMRDKPDFVAAGVFYALYTFGLVWLVLLPALSGVVNWVDLAFRCALFGLVAYATYNLTGLSVINGWSLKLSLIDMAWGSFVTLATGLGTVFLVKMMGR
ncbi:hypothetical protein ABI_05380 [Asticcacaulis biprosthecium C19]|uniref:Transmembrane protein n=1 Tax=Asticcacaulis biprosthecium C19 TaxID=715226 RepID=F4QKF3_9CAUL|nr:DUF2177 family protein [Asticcacaulis biprosthecium]EGF92105.1 hypothetical protein ABI_05380 [Asticcacaulis biprosthecium C19]